MKPSQRSLLATRNGLRALRKAGWVRSSKLALSTGTASLSEPSSWDYDVLIGGGGIVGASVAARLLSKSSGQLKIGIVENRPPPSISSCLDRPTPDIRVYALSLKSINMLQEIDAWRHIESRSQPYENMQVWETYGPGLVRFTAKDIGVPELGRITEDATIQAAIYEAMKEKGHSIDLIFDTSITNVTVASPGPNSFGPATVTLTPNNKTQQSSTAAAAVTGATTGTTTGLGAADQSKLHNHDTDANAGPKTVTARLVVGADGGNSAIRRLSGIPTWGWGYGVEAVVCTVKVALPQGGSISSSPSDPLKRVINKGSTAWQRYLPTGPLALLPLWDDFYSIVWSVPTTAAQRLRSLPTEDFLKELNFAMQSPSQTDRWSVLEANDATIWPSVAGGSESGTSSSPLSLLLSALQSTAKNLPLNIPLGVLNPNLNLGLNSVPSSTNPAAVAASVATAIKDRSTEISSRVTEIRSSLRSAAVSATTGTPVAAIVSAAAAIEASFPSPPPISIPTSTMSYTLPSIPLPNIPSIPSIPFPLPNIPSIPSIPLPNIPPAISSAVSPFADLVNSVATNIISTATTPPSASTATSQSSEAFSTSSSTSFSTSSTSTAADVTATASSTTSTAATTTTIDTDAARTTINAAEVSSSSSSSSSSSTASTSSFVPPPQQQQPSPYNNNSDSSTYSSSSYSNYDHNHSTPNIPGDTIRLFLESLATAAVIKPLNTLKREVAAVADTAMSAAQLKDPFISPPVVVGLASPRVGFPLQFQQAKAYYSPRVALVGDAAHSIHPQAGQGLNLGLGDADELSTVVLGALATGQDIGSPAVLRAYGDKQYFTDLAMMTAVDSINTVFAVGGKDRAKNSPFQTVAGTTTGPNTVNTGGGLFSKAVHFAVSAGMLGVHALGPVKDRMARFALGVDSKGRVK